LALRTAQEGIVLLKNEKNLLPLDRTTIDHRGDWSERDDERNQLGDYTSKTISRRLFVLKGIRPSSPRPEVIHVKGCNVRGRN